MCALGVLGQLLSSLLVRLGPSKEEAIIDHRTQAQQQQSREEGAHLMATGVGGGAVVGSPLRRVVTLAPWSVSQVFSCITR
jgi:hypothetical protein